MSSTNLTFTSRDAHRAWLAGQAALPAGFRVGSTRLDFTPREAPKPARMTLTLIATDRPAPGFAAVFTRNAFPGAPVIIGRRRLAEPALGAIIINNKISNVCAPDGLETAARVCAETARLLGLAPEQVLPSSTGVIGWSLPAADMAAALPRAVAALSAASALPAAEGIVTTDLYPKIRRAAVGETGASIVGIAKGAGMIEPDLATMLVYVLTDLDVPRDTLRAMLARAVDDSFNTISIDSDTSTSDTVVLLSSGKIPVPAGVAAAGAARGGGGAGVPPAAAGPAAAGPATAGLAAGAGLAAFEAALGQVCRDLAEDIVRNGEGVRHVIRVRVTGAPDRAAARALGKAVVNAPLFKCAVAGNDPNVGRLVQAIGKHAGTRAPGLALGGLRARMGGIEIFAGGAFRLDPRKEAALAAHLRDAELYASAPDAAGLFVPPVDYPAHERCVEIELDLASGPGACTVLGGDLTHEYVTENADYRS
ncbi:MAG: bifunctional ornithine acetyltransferase/N-acetylglutamate synthase [Opitutaceae bacterium]|nr:bifunctional ornithine acetyltransferase/N-acetylglutamate synthase [Opitutaceae bacterium]